MQRQCKTNGECYDCFHKPNKTTGTLTEDIPSWQARSGGRYRLTHAHAAIATDVAFANYQRDHGLYATSAIDEPTLVALGMA
jgi:hypothetical protein